MTGVERKVAGGAWGRSRTASLWSQESRDLYGPDRVACAPPRTAPGTLYVFN